MNSPWCNDRTDVVTPKGRENGENAQGRKRGPIAGYESGMPAHAFVTGRRRPLETAPIWANCL
jgi:hypothetical protein